MIIMCLFDGIEHLLSLKRKNRMKGQTAALFSMFSFGF